MRERRPIGAPMDSVSEMGRSRDLIACPFCGRHVWAFRWSRCGSGKRCECGALLCRENALAPLTDPALSPRKVIPDGTPV